MLEQRDCGGAKVSRYNFPNEFLERYTLRIGTLVCLGFLVLGCGASTTPSEVIVSTLSIRSLYPEALEVAKDWKEDAYLVEAQVSFGESSVDEYQYADFDFRSPSTKIVGLSVWYDPATDSFRDEWLSIAKVDPSREPEIKDSDWHIDSTEALEIAQAHGGAEFLAGRSDSHLYLYLRLEKRQNNGQPLTVWLAAYYDETAGEELFVVIDALSGEVVETSR
jgi:hypothetical protein